ncbi:hypothetical protein AVEN_12733-1 [Araneus ventricosus]|uniref:Uncharacterized protein n=1 Tax=Araneus ventricosus TaxID=182803 RepID=A0A4Y2ACP7_ARAVE|nr:hypothetical protein AVEN_12733-1 [Araneus ventricosus]
MTRTTPELASPPNFHTTPAGEHFTHDIRIKVHQAHIHDGSSVGPGYELGILRSRSRDFTTWPPRPSTWFGVEVWKGERRFQCDACRLTKVKNYDIYTQQPSYK